MEFERGHAKSGPRYGFDLVVGLDEIRRQVYLAGERTAKEHRSLHRAVPADGLRHGRETDLASLNRGVRQRSIVGLGDLTDPSIYAYFAEVHSQGEEVRTLHEVPTRLLIFDDDIAVLPVEPFETPRRAMFVRDRTLIDVLTYLFDRMWSDASPVFADIDASETRSDRHVRVLELLAGGAKDEAIARTLGIGVRTIRRDIAELKAVLNVTSRAEVVAAAVRRGWL
jgi:DNA-binding CsgD family transcriptional regulator